MKIKLFKALLIIGILASTFESCNQDDDSTYRLNTRMVELNCRTTQALKVTPTLPGLSYTSLNTNIATVSAEGLITAKLVGTTKIVVKDSLNVFVDTVKVVVKSENTLFDDPYLEFGINYTTLLNKLNITEYRFGYPLSGGFRINFTAKGFDWAYCFTDDNKYIYTSVFVPQAQYSQLESHLNDRYNIMITKRYGESETFYNVDSYYISPDSTLIVLDYRLSMNTGSIIDFYPATQEKIQLVLSDETHPDLR